MIRFHNGRVLRFAGDMRLTGDEVWTDGGEIAYVGPARADAPVFERTVNLNGDVLMPGFKNAHTHTAMTFLRSYADDMPLNDWLYKQVFPHEAKVTPEMLYVFTKLGILEYLSSGITASFDMYFHNDAYARANIDSGFRTVICAALNNFDKDVENIEREYLKFNALDELVSYRLGIHAEYTTCRERMEYLCALAHKYQEPCFTHLCETRAEVDGCIGRYGLTPPQLLDSLGFFDYGGGGFHCVWMSDEDVALFARKQLWAVTNPCSNLKLASGICPVDRLAHAGIPLAIGTDGAASNNALNLFRELNLVTLLHKGLRGDPTELPASQGLRMATENGARALGWEKLGRIEAGWTADLAVLDLDRVNLRPWNDLLSSLAYAAGGSEVESVMVEGKFLMKDREFLTIDRERVQFEVDRTCKRLGLL